MPEERELAIENARQRAVHEGQPVAVLLWNDLYYLWDQVRVDEVVFDERFPTNLQKYGGKVEVLIAVVKADGTVRHVMRSLKPKVATDKL